jgi:ferric-dicitrate binding protein FerR (iron transport regulator)
VTAGQSTHPHSNHPHVEMSIGATRAGSRWATVLTGAIVVLILGVAAWLLSRNAASASLWTELGKTDVRTLNTLPAQMGDISLLDGTKVKLGPESVLRIPAKFNKKVRGVGLDGSANFTVAPGNEREFVVIVGKASIVATGTEFAVRAYPDEQSALVHARSGEIKVVVGDSSLKLSAGASLLITKEGALRQPDSTEVVEAVGWADGTVTMLDRPLRDVLPEVRRWFGLTFTVGDPSLLNRTVTLRAPFQSPEEARKSIEASGNLQRVWAGENQVLISKGRPASKR